jgi:hypothetical protein
MMSTLKEQRMIACHFLGRRDAQEGKPETHPIHPFADYELEAYQAGYRGERKRMKETRS